MSENSYTSIRVKKSTRAKFRILKRFRRWPMGEIAEILADRELAAIKAEQSALNTSPGGSGANDVSLPPLPNTARATAGA